MELRKHLDARKIFIVGYFVLFAVYLIIGFQPADATRYEISGNLSIPSASISTDVARLTLTDNRLDTPNYIAGEFSVNSNKTLLIGHSTTVFRDLFNVKVGDKIQLDDKTYTIRRLELREKDVISMLEILQSEDVDTLVIMTCAGELYDDGDASHRFLVTATL